MDISRFGLVASIVFNAWQFFCGGCKADMKFFCRCRKEEISAGQMFLRMRNYIFVRPDSLPLDANIKAVGINFNHSKHGARLYLETTLLDWALVQEKLAEFRSQYEGLEVRGRGFFWNGKRVLDSNSRHHFGNVTTPRTLIYTTGNPKSSPMDPLVLAADLVYDHTCFVTSAMPRVESEGDDSPPVLEMSMRQVQTLSQDMRQEMHQLIVQEQVPKLMMTLRMQASLFQRMDVLRMNSQELNTHVRQALAENPCLKAKGE